MKKEITNITAEQIYDSRGNPTIKVSVIVDNIVGTFQVPSGASTGKYEAYELRDDNTGKGGMNNAIEKIETTIKPVLVGLDIFDQKLIDQKMVELDGTPQKTNLGGNSMIGVSIACAKVAATLRGVEVYEYLKTLEEIKPSKKTPFLYFNLINGGKHASSSLAFQEYHIVPQIDDLSTSVDMCRAIQEKLDELILEKYKILPKKGDEGGIALSVEDVTEPLMLLAQAVESLGYSHKVKFALDVASSSFYDEKSNLYKFGGRNWTKEELAELYHKITSSYPIISIEDPFDEEDYDSFSKLQKALPNIKLVGDDLTVTSIERLKRAIRDKSIEAIIIKPNQVGTLSETLATMALARENDIDCIVSHRSGETMDDFIADLAYAFGCFGIKAGALGPKERNIKYNRLIDIVK